MNFNKRVNQPNRRNCIVGLDPYISQCQKPLPPKTSFSRISSLANFRVGTFEIEYFKHKTPFFFLPKKRIFAKRVEITVSCFSSCYDRFSLVDGDFWSFLIDDINLGIEFELQLLRKFSGPVETRASTVTLEV